LFLAEISSKKQRKGPHDPRVSGNFTRKKIIVASTLGFIIGLIAGLLGVGGGEFRLPVLICLIGFPVAIAAVANLVIGLLTVTVSLATRLVVGMVLPEAIGVIVVMSAASIAGAYAGAAITDRVKERYLKSAVGVLLVAVGVKMIYDAFAHEAPSGLALGYLSSMLLAALLGALIGVVSGALGVAGGELRIPAFMYFFNMPIKTAGTASLFVTIPTVATGAVKHTRMKHVSRGVVIICVAMAIPSAIGAAIGGRLALAAGEAFLKALLGVVLLLATVRIMKP
jgi:uncharacterized membrane protein YfcA